MFGTEPTDLEGIISERDLAYGLATYAADLPSVRVSDLMTRTVVTCSPRDTIGQVANVMTQQRIPHLPVKGDQRLVGIVTIGDILKHRLEGMIWTSPRSKEPSWSRLI